MKLYLLNWIVHKIYTEFVESKLDSQTQVANMAFDKLDMSVSYSNELKTYLESTIAKTQTLESILEKNTLYLQHLGDVSDEKLC